jgi:hypothetical protein
MKNRIIIPSEFSGAYVGQTLDHTTQKNWNFAQKNVPYWAIVIFTRVSNALIFPPVESISPEMSFLMNQFFRL